VPGTQRRAFARAPEAVADMDDFDPTVTNSPKFRLIAGDVNYGVSLQVGSGQGY